MVNTNFNKNSHPCLSLPTDLFPFSLPELNSIPPIRATFAPLILPALISVTRFDEEHKLLTFSLYIYPCKSKLAWLAVCRMEMRFVETLGPKLVNVERVFVVRRKAVLGRAMLLNSFTLICKWMFFAWREGRPFEWRLLRAKLGPPASEVS
jgi:hypothetical protein